MTGSTSLTMSTILGTFTSGTEVWILTTTSTINEMKVLNWLPVFNRIYNQEISGILVNDVPGKCGSPIGIVTCARSIRRR